MSLLSTFFQFRFALFANLIDSSIELSFGRLSGLVFCFIEFLLPKSLGNWNFKCKSRKSKCLISLSGRFLTEIVFHQFRWQSGHTSTMHLQVGKHAILALFFSAPQNHFAFGLKICRPFRCTLEFSCECLSKILFNPKDEIYLDKQPECGSRRDSVLLSRSILKWISCLRCPIEICIGNSCSCTAVLKTLTDEWSEMMLR